jgi:undecaprenyl-diphosphatase
MDSISFREAFGIGVAQTIALVPGISRSGISISAGLFMGLNREAAARFSFLMATPVIGGAGLWEARKFLTHEAGPNPELNVILIGFVAAAVSGLLAIRFLLAFLRRQSVNAFVVYRVVAAVVVVIVLLSPHGA